MYFSFLLYLPKYGIRFGFSVCRWSAYIFMLCVCVCVWCCRLTFEIIFHFLSSGWFASTGTLQFQRCMVDSAIVFPCILIWTVTFNNNVDRNVLKRQQFTSNVYTLYDEWAASVEQTKSVYIHDTHESRKWSEVLSIIYIFVVQTIHELFWRSGESFNPYK